MHTSSNTIAARAGRWSARHRRTAIVGWFLVVIVAFTAGNGLGLTTIDDSELGTGESGRAERIAAKAFPVENDSASEAIHVQRRAGDVRSPAFRAVVADVAARVARVDGVTKVDSPYTAGGAAQLSPNGRSATVNFDIRDGDDQAADLVEPALAATAAAQAAHPDYRIEQFGDASVEKAVGDSLSRDFSSALKLSLPITLAILVIAFGALVAAGIPLVLALTGVLGTLGLVAIGSQAVPMDETINEVVLLVGLAVGVDYSLFYLRREREERAAGRSEHAALEAAAATSGHAVLMSGLTVMVAMAGMFLAGSPVFTSFAIGTILVVAVAMIGSLTVLPALLSKLGDRVNRGRVPFVGGRAGGARESRIWGALLRPVLRRPLPAALVSGGLLAALAVPAFGLHTADSGVDGIPGSLPIVATYDRMQEAFPGAQLPAVVVVQADDVTTPAVRDGIARLRAQARGTDGVGGAAIDVEVSRDHRVATIAVPLAGNGTDATSTAALARVRGDLVPHTVGAVDGVRAAVMGATAESADFNALMKARAPIVFAFVLGMAFVLMLVMFRSVVVPAKAIALNLLSVGAAYGVLKLVFQDGWLSGPLGFEPTGAVTSWIPMFLFVILFGLSMDYHVFILSRVREAYLQGMSTPDAVAHGIRSTAGVVTSAAIVMVAVFAVFASLSFLELKMLGVGLGTAVLVDATIVRGVLLPATMTLLGERNWYLPRWLEWLPGGDRGEPTGARRERPGTTGQLGSETS